MDDLEKIIDEKIKTAIAEAGQSYEVVRHIPFHTHNGIDSPNIDFTDLLNVRLSTSHTIVGADAATAANYGTFFIAPYPLYVQAIREVHETAGSDGSAVTLQVEKLTGTTAKDSGTVLLSTAFDLKGTANTVQTGTLVTSSYPTIQNNTQYLSTGDRLALKDSGTLTALSNVTVTVTFLVV